MMVSCGITVRCKGLMLTNNMQRSIYHSTAATPFHGVPTQTIAEFSQVLSSPSPRVETCVLCFSKRDAHAWEAEEEGMAMVPVGGC